MIKFKNEASARRFIPASRGRIKDIGGIYAKDLEGDLILVKGGFDSEIVRYVVYHEYMHFLVSASGYDLPTWLNEGLAELYSTVEISDRSATIGREAEWRSLVLDGENLIPLERLFEINEASPEYNNRKHGQGTFYAQSWGLVHYLTLGNTKVPRGAVWKLVDRILSERIVSEEAFREITGLDFDQMERSLKRYIRAGSYRPIKMDKPKLPTDETLELSYASEGETDLIEGMLFLAMKRPKEAYAPLEHAYRKLPNSAKAAAYQGYLHLIQDQYAEAVKAFEETIERGSKSPSTYLFHAASILFRDNPEEILEGEIFDKKETVRLLSLLFRARELGERRALLYRWIGQVWLNSELTAREGHLMVLNEGLGRHRDDGLLAYYLAQLLFNIEKYEEAGIIVRDFLKKDITDGSKRLLEDLEEQIESRDELAAG